MDRHTEKLELVAIDKLVPYINNARTHSPAQIKQIQASIREFGFINPVLIDGKHNIIAGHGRIMAAKNEGLDRVPCLFIEHLTEAQKKAYIIADNKLAENAGWDMELLRVELEGLQALDFNMDLIGFDDIELDDLFSANDAEVMEDDFVVELPDEPITKRGDIWQLGKHRLMCGDSTSGPDIKTSTQGNPIYLVFTDPPYGMSAVSKSGVLKEKYKTDILNDGDNSVAILSFELCQQMFKQSNQVWWGANYYSECLPSSECWIVWDKNNGGSDQTDCELAWANFRSVVRKFTMASEKKNRVHPTQKPVKLIAEIVDKFDKQNTFKNVLDLFGGSGSTLIACEQLNRICYMMELDPKYCDVIIDRWEQFTGEKTVLLT